MEISKNLKKYLKSKSLIISAVPDFPKDHVAYPNGYIVIKPAYAGGNSAPNYESWFIENGKKELSNAPPINIYAENGKYYAEVSVGLGGKAPGDFKREFKAEETLGNFVSKYFFGETSEFQALAHS